MDELPARAAHYYQQQPERASVLPQRARLEFQPARSRFRALEEATLEHVRREILLRPNFAAIEFERAFQAFRSLYQIRPSRVSCSPNILVRYCALFERSAHCAHSRHIRYQGIPMNAAILAPGIVAFEGEVDEERMGDW